MIAATDVDGPGLVLGLAGGGVAARFAVDAATGAPTFAAAPDFEAPGDADGDYVYEVVVSASDGIAPAVTQTLSVIVTDVDEGGGGGELLGQWLFDDAGAPGADGTANGDTLLLRGGAGRPRRTVRRRLTG
ncbi:MAG: hypothetical protein AAF360_02520 [Pseudomonadota bacterium]